MHLPFGLAHWVHPFATWFTISQALFGSEGPAFLSGFSNGEVVISGATSAIVLSYVVAYSYYLQQIEAEATEAATKQAAVADKAKIKKADASESLGDDLEDESSPTTTTPDKSTRRHRFRFWKNRQKESQ